MSYYRGVARDEFGNSLNEASVSVFEPDGVTLATIYSEETLTTGQANPFTTGADGVYDFYSDPGYYDIQVAKTGFTTVTLANQVVGGVFGFAWDNPGNSNACSPGTYYPLTANGVFAVDWNLEYAGSFELTPTTKTLTYTGEPSGWFKLSASVGYINTSNIADHYLRVEINGSPLSPTRGLVIRRMGAGENDTLNLSYHIFLEKDDEVRLAFAVGSAHTVGIYDCFLSVEGIG